jgi:hypothetical protein
VFERFGAVPMQERLVTFAPEVVADGTSEGVRHA